MWLRNGKVVSDMRKWLKSDYIPAVLSLLMIALYPVLFVYLMNADQTSLKETLPAIGIFVGTALAIWAVLLVCRMPVAKAALTSAVAALLIQNFHYFEKVIGFILPNVYYWHVVYFAILVICVAGVIITKKVTEQTAVMISWIAAATFAVLILVNLISAAPTIVRKLYNQIQNTNSIEVVMDTETRMPNVYYFIFDEYSGPDGLQYYCDDDDSEFYDALEALNFNVSYHSYNEYCNGEIGTINAIPEMLNLEKVITPEMTYDQKSELLKSPYLYRCMHEAGYSIHIIDIWDFLDKESADSYHDDAALAESSNLTAMSIIISKTAWYPFFQQDTESEIWSLKESFKEAGKSYELGVDKNSFVLGYWGFPHIPYLVDENGNKIDETDRYNAGDYSLYLSQLKYAGKSIVDVVEEIIKNDEDSIIILQSDHGFRPNVHLANLDEPTNMREEEPLYMRNILNAVYYKGDELSIEGLTGLDTVTMVFGRLMEEDYE